MPIIKIKDQEIAYQTKKSRRVKRVGLRLNMDKSLTITYPYRLDPGNVELLIKKKLAWILRQMKKLDGLTILDQGKKEFLENKSAHLTTIKERIDHFSAHYGFRVGKVSIKNVRSYWGLCSRQGNINFNFKALFLPVNVLDYLIVHELCHLKQHNHSKKYWQEVERVLPDYKLLRKELRKYSYMK